MTLFERVHMPSFAGTTEWLNSEPLGPAELRGHTVLVNFWTFTCINWPRQEPHVRAWSQAYRDDGLGVIGVHTPEFSFEHENDDVRRATKQRGIDYPVVVDNGYEVWSAFDNHYWPALYFIDKDGVIRDQHFGEGRNEQSEGARGQLTVVDADELLPRFMRDCMPDSPVFLGLAADVIRQARAAGRYKTVRWWGRNGQCPVGARGHRRQHEPR